MSSQRLVIRSDTLDAQRRASNPQASAWVSANAGSGKTFVLTQRVVRLLLEGVPPSKILCLTFTKAAAANMSMRVFRTLAEWTRLDDSALSAAIEAMGAGVPDEARMKRARRLFAQTVETPGGLKIQTIHAFCERLLHLFPFEANVAAGFEVIDERRETDLMDASRDAALSQAALDPDSRLGRAVQVIASETSAASFRTLLDEALAHRETILEALQVDGDGSDYVRNLSTMLGVTPADTPEAIDQAIVHDGFQIAEWPSIAATLAEGSSSDKAAGERLTNAVRATNDASRLVAYKLVFLTKEDGPRSRLVTNDLRRRHPDFAAKLDAEKARIVDLLNRRRAAMLVQRSRALLVVAHAIFDAYEGAKRYRGLLDFDDLIERTSQLLERAAAAWVLYKLDAGIDHILVDEAQDTSPKQWDILGAIAEDFLGGATARNHARTFFAVGDEKQSIYSFQGADPRKFSEMRSKLHKRHTESGKLFEKIDLKMSFRSSAQILAPIDAIFALAGNRRGLSNDDVATVHQAAKAELPGLVEIWPLAGPQAAEAPRDWRMPLDLPGAQDPPVVVARRIARTVRAWLSPDSRESVHDIGGPRPIRAGDVLILVRRRGPFFEAVIRELKNERVPVAGADRLNLTQHIAILDLVALGRACLLPQDDLALACVLKSPLLGLDDDDLITIAPGRSGTLLDALEDSEQPRHAAAADRLDRWRQQASRMTPFVFYAHVLGADGGRRDMIERLGPEAGDALDEFLREALNHERDEAPSLTRFLHRFENSELQIKRDMEAGGDAVRVMTVHAAKGLEAKIVFLPDTCGSPSGRHDPKLFALGAADARPLLAWSPTKDDDPTQVTDARGRRRADEEDEYRRLLYVAMTRAEERLYIAGFHGKQEPKAECWYHMVRTALAPSLTEHPADFDAEITVWRTASTAPPARAPEAAATGTAETSALPAWLLTAAPGEQPPAPPISPSNALARADQMQAPSESARLARADAAFVGTLVHALLQHLPAVDVGARERAAERFLALRAGRIDAGRRTEIARQVLAVLDDATLAPLFGPASRAEVSVAGRVTRSGRPAIDIAGQIDRLVDTGAEILIADFKTGAAKPGVAMPRAYVTQLALYRAALQPLWPARNVRAFIVWTSGPTVSEIDIHDMDAALSAL